MKILLVGASGTSARQSPASSANSIRFAAGRSSGELRVDLTDDASVAELFARTGPVDGYFTAGKLHFGPLQQMTPAQFNLGLQDKLLGQVRLALAAAPSQQRRLDHPDQRHRQRTTDPRRRQRHLGECRTGRLRARSRTGAAAARPAHQRGQPERTDRIDGRHGPYFPGFEAVSAQRAALAFQRAVEGIQSGETITVW